MEKITKERLDEIMSTFNSANPDKQDTPVVSAVIVFKESNWTIPYTEQERSYRVWNCNRHFQTGRIGNSLFGDCLDGMDLGVKLSGYNWTIDYCYMEQ